MAATMATVGENRTLRAADVCRLAGCTFRQLDHWCRSYPICAGRTSVEGGGPRLRFTDAEARVVRALVRLGAAGVVATAHVHGVIAAVAACPGAEWLVVGGTHTWATAAPDELIDAIRLDETTIVVPLAYAGKEDA